jgi:hypothetical protein
MLSCGVPLPAQHFEHLDLTFVNFLLNIVEKDVCSDTDVQMASEAASLLLAYNTHFAIEAAAQNTLMEAVVGRTFAALGQKLVGFVNRGTDPLAAQQDVAGAGSNSVLKLLCDVYSGPTTGELFLFTSDLYVLIDVLARELTDREPGDPKRLHYVQLHGARF